MEDGFNGEKVSAGVASRCVDTIRFHSIRFDSINHHRRAAIQRSVLTGTLLTKRINVSSIRSINFFAILHGILDRKKKRENIQRRFYTKPSKKSFPLSPPLFSPFSPQFLFLSATSNSIPKRTEGNDKT